MEDLKIKDSIDNANYGFNKSSVLEFVLYWMFYTLVVTLYSTYIVTYGISENDKQYSFFENLEIMCKHFMGNILLLTGITAGTTFPMIIAAVRKYGRKKLEQIANILNHEISAANVRDVTIIPDSLKSAEIISETETKNTTTSIKTENMESTNNYFIMQTLQGQPVVAHETRCIIRNGKKYKVVKEESSFKLLPWDEAKVVLEENPELTKNVLSKKLKMF